MSTQHPDNVHQPFFVENGMLGGEDEVQEAFYAFSHLGCDEQMWDFEGKEVDNFVVKKLLTKNEQFFKSKKLGQDVFLTLRVPNPEVEQTEAKILLETLESIPRSYDAARLFYGSDIAPIFEVILPMATSAKSLNRIYHYYKDFVAGKFDKLIFSGDITIGEWIGEFRPKEINVIPLFEDKNSLLNCAEILDEYVKGKDLPYVRVFLARSDPAVNYGNIATVILVKIALQRLYRWSQKTGIPVYPILGAGSAPFRGNLRPSTVEQLIAGYPSVHTFTIQSSFKFDNPVNVVQDAITKLNTRQTGAPVEIDEEKALALVEIYLKVYQEQLKELIIAIKKVSSFIPKRRKRKMHIGLFGYSRNVGEVQLPRAITFTAALYSLGIPPELLAFNSLTQQDFSFIKSFYGNIEYDLQSACAFADFDSSYMPRDVRDATKFYAVATRNNFVHKEISSYISQSIFSGKIEDLSSHVVHAAEARGFLG